MSRLWAVWCDGRPLESAGARSQPLLTSVLQQPGFTLLVFSLEKSVLLNDQLSAPAAGGLGQEWGAGVTSFLVMSSGKAQKPDGVRFGV